MCTGIGDGGSGVQERKNTLLSSVYVHKEKKKKKRVARVLKNDYDFRP